MSDVTVAQLTTLAIALGAIVAVAGLAILYARLNPKVSPGPIFVAAAVLLLGLYVLGCALDLAAGWLSARPLAFHDSLSERIVLGRFPALRPLLPLRQYPLLAAPVHTACAFGLFLVLIKLVWWVGELRTLEESTYAPHWRDLFGFCGYGRNLRTIEERTLVWLRPLSLAGLVLLAAAFLELHYRDPREPPLSPFLWAVATSLAVAATVNWLSSRRQDEAARAKPEEKPAEPPPLEVSAWLAALRAHGFEIDEEHARVSAEAPALQGAPRPGAGFAEAELQRELLEVLTGGKGLYSHQEEALARVAERKHLLLLAPPRAGKTTAAQLAAVRTALGEGKNALFVLRDRESAALAAAELGRTLARTSWSQNLRCTVAGPEMQELLAQRRSPVLTFSFADALEETLGAYRDHAYLLEHLGLVVIEDLERYSGVRAANLHFRMRRLLAVLELLHGRPVLCGTIGTPARDLERYAETLLGVDLAVVATDGAPTCAVRQLAAIAPATETDGIPAAAIAAAEAQALGLPLSLLGFAAVTATELERAASRVSRAHAQLQPAAPERARVSLAELTPASIDRVLAAARHLGSAQEEATRGEHLQLLIPALDPVSRWLARDLERAFASGSEGRRTLIADLASGPLRERHLRRALAELPSAELDWARRVFGGEAIERLERAGLLERDRSPEPRGEPPALRVVERVRFTAGARATRPGVLTGDTIGDDPVRVVDRATGTVIRRLDPGRAALVAYPGAVLLYRGRRFRVSSEPPSYAAGSEVGAELHGEDVQTIRIRSIHTSILDPGELRPLSLGGATVRGGLCAVAVTETVTGARRHRSDGSLDGIEAFAPLTASFRSLARVLCVGVVGEAALQAFANLLRPCLAAVMDCGEEGLEVATAMALDGADPTLAAEGPVLLLIDSYEGGAGYARAVDSRVLREALRLALAILEETCCSEGCPRCVRTIHCHVEDPSRIPLDRAGARALTSRLLGLDRERG
jgi:ATP-dependent helicase YprA (DUF1998 family)